MSKASFSLLTLLCVFVGLSAALGIFVHYYYRHERIRVRLEQQRRILMIESSIGILDRVLRTYGIQSQEDSVQSNHENSGQVLSVSENGCRLFVWQWDFVRESKAITVHGAKIKFTENRRSAAQLRIEVPIEQDLDLLPVRILHMGGAKDSLLTAHLCQYLKANGIDVIVVAKAAVPSVPSVSAEAAQEPVKPPEEPDKPQK